MLDSLLGESSAIDNVISGKELTYDDGMELMNDDNLHVLGAAADFVRQKAVGDTCLLYTSPSPRDGLLSRMPSSA